LLGKRDRKKNQKGIERERKRMRNKKGQRERERGE
jgi:hypothetical protein